MRAVIDRFEGDYAVVLVGDEESKIDIKKEYLPDGAKEGSWLKMSFELDPEGEQGQRKKISTLLEKLKSKQR